MHFIEHRTSQESKQFLPLALIPFHYYLWSVRMQFVCWQRPLLRRWMHILIFQKGYAVIVFCNANANSEVCIVVVNNDVFELNWMRKMLIVACEMWMSILDPHLFFHSRSVDFEWKGRRGLMFASVQFSYDFLSNLCLYLSIKLPLGNWALLPSLY